MPAERKGPVWSAAFVDSDGCMFTIGDARYGSDSAFVPVHPRIWNRDCQMLKTLEDAIPPGTGLGAIRILNMLVPDFESWLMFEVP
ncbi:MAG TPA: hypothetical protein VGX00_02340 [Thermoplasmata archaeon]|nr:hypothetical protein [Thermoplasmata archaeon]